MEEEASKSTPYEIHTLRSGSFPTYKISWFGTNREIKQTYKDQQIVGTSQKTKPYLPKTSMTHTQWSCSLSALWEKNTICITFL